MQELLQTAAGQHTYFAPAERSSRVELEQDLALFNQPSPISAVLDAVPMVVMVLNRNRQLVFCNRAVLTLFNRERIQDLLGLRPGDIFHCTHCEHSGNGCGTTEFCRHCGAVQSILESQKGVVSVNECNIMTEQEGQIRTLELRVWATPFAHQNKLFTIFAAADIQLEKRLAKLQRAFFHDVFNTIGGLAGAVDTLRLGKSEDLPASIGMLQRLVKRLIDEVESHRLLASAEDDRLSVQHEHLHSHDLLRQVMDIYVVHPCARDRQVKLIDTSENISFISDGNLIARVLSNMIKNALEASEAGQTVIVGSRKIGEQVQFYVHNRGIMPPEVQRQLFKRSFSTKDLRRGLGVYSMKLLSERYLHGAVTFVSTPEQGTTFFAAFPLRSPVGEDQANY